MCGCFCNCFVYVLEEHLYYHTAHTLLRFWLGFGFIVVHTQEASMLVLCGGMCLYKYTSALFQAQAVYRQRLLTLAGINQHIAQVGRQVYLRTYLVILKTTVRSMSDNVCKLIRSLIMAGKGFTEVSCLVEFLLGWYGRL